MGFRRNDLTRFRPKHLSLLLFACSALMAKSAVAEEPRSVTEPRVLEEPAEITQVVDAFDGEDAFDIHLTLGYQFSSRSAAIRRETAIAQPGLTTGGYVSDDLNVAQYSETTNRLNTRVDVGLYRDIALVLRMPIILSNNRELDDLDGSEATQSIGAQGVPGEQLFSVPFNAPTRSGIEYLAVGFDFGIMNQARDYTKPTWVFGIEGRFNVSEPMHACNENPSPGQVKCAYPSDINRNGRSDGALEGSFNGSRDAGVSRGTTGLELHTHISKRIKYIEPYAGFRALFEFQNDSSDYGISDLEGTLTNHPPLRGSTILGVNVVPWEIRDQFQRISFDFRFTGTYISEGRDYSELFDALGSSSARSLRNPHFAEYQPNLTDPNDPNSVDPNLPSVVNPNSQKVYFTGLTDVQAHGSYTLSTQFTWQAGEYVKFNLGAGYTLVQSHFITFDQSCNPDFSGDATRAGPCRAQTGDGAAPEYRATGLPNPNFRKIINDPGRRFRVDSVHGLDAWLNATVMF